MHQLINKTPFTADMSIFQDEQGVDTLYLMVKASFKIGHKWQLADKQRSLCIKDDYWGEPDDSSIKFASDYHIGKPATDIIVIGNAYSQNDKKVRQLDVNARVGAVEKTIRVFGDRVWQNGQMTLPEPFQIMPLVYERAFGGSYIKDEEIISTEARNPLGCGFAGKRKAIEMNQVNLPNLEDPENLIRSPKDTPEPTCFAFVSPSWQNRQKYAGTYDDAWQLSRAPYLPLDFDRRFFNMAHPDLIYPGYLQGGESVTLTNMHREGDIAFNLPEVCPLAEVNIKAHAINLPFSMETLILQPEIMELSMVWRAALPCDKAALKIKDINIVLNR